MTIKGILAGVMALAFMGTVGLLVMATGVEQADPVVEAREGHAESRGFMDHLHELGQRLHGGGHPHTSHAASHMVQMAELLGELDLTDAQRTRFERVHAILGERNHHDPAEMAELHDKLMGQFEAGQVETGPLHDLIDTHLEQMREMAYGVTDEMIGLLNELDEKQRELLQTRLADLHGHDG